MSDCKTKVTVRGGGKVVVSTGTAQRITLSPMTVARVNAARPATTVKKVDSPVEVVDRRTTVRTGSSMGLQGVPGATEGATFLAQTATPISALRALKVVGGVASYADAANVADALLINAISITAASGGTQVLCRTAGEIVEPLWNWAPGPVYCGADGHLTQTVPATGFICEVGRSHAPTKITVEIQTPIIRG